MEQLRGVVHRGDGEPRCRPDRGRHQQQPELADPERGAHPGEPMPDHPGEGMLAARDRRAAAPLSADCGGRRVGRAGVAIQAQRSRSGRVLVGAACRRPIRTVRAREGERRGRRAFPDQPIEPLLGFAEARPDTRPLADIRLVGTPAQVTEALLAIVAQGAHQITVNFADVPRPEGTWLFAAAVLPHLRGA